jgi:hypothetical protein
VRPEEKYRQTVQPKAEAVVEKSWKQFQALFGLQLQPAFTPDHRLVRIRAGEEAAKPASDFSSGDKKAALARAQEILRQAADLLELRADYPLQAQAVRSDEISSQVEWVQTYHGVPIEPYGRITLQLDAQGGVRGLFSSYISDPLIVNAPSLDDAQARGVAISNLHFTPERPLEAGQIQKGDLILFAQGPQDSAAPIELKYAYRYWISGHEIVVDAERGDIISERDRRQN